METPNYEMFKRNIIQIVLEHSPELVAELAKERGMELTFKPKASSAPQRAKTDEHATEWVNHTPEESPENVRREYGLYMLEDPGPANQWIDIGREEFLVLKSHLASLRGLGVKDSGEPKPRPDANAWVAYTPDEKDGADDFRLAVYESGGAALQEVVVKRDEWIAAKSVVAALRGLGPAGDKHCKIPLPDARRALIQASDHEAQQLAAVLKAMKAEQGGILTPCETAIDKIVLNLSVHGTISPTELMKVANEFIEDVKDKQELSGYHLQHPWFAETAGKFID